MKNKSICVPGLIFLLSLCPLFPLEETLILGKEDNWRGVSLTNSIFREGKEGFLDILLDDNEYTPTEESDLLLHFNSIAELNQLSNYRLKEFNGSLTSRVSLLGEGVGVFEHQKETIVLEGNQGSLFFPGISWKDFSIEFWLYPASLEEGETVLLWQGSRFQEGEIIHQELRVDIQRQRLNWRFENFFLPPDRSNYSVHVTGFSPLIPRSWGHHLLRFDSSTGLLEYLINGEPEGITHATATGREDGSIYFPKLGENPESFLTIGSYFTGFMDELRISSRFVDDPSIKKLGTSQGSFVTAPIDLGYTNTRITAIDVLDSTPEDSDIFYYYRVADVLIDLQLDRKDWVPFRPDAAFPEEIRGKYLQIRGELYPDGTQSRSPALSALTIRYEPDLPPLPPTGLMANGGNSMINVSWDPVPDEDISGYLLYYGEEPGVYFGNDAIEGPSPIDVGDTESFVLTGMENGKLYYITLVSYDGTDPPHYSELGREISVRPNVLGAGR